MIRRLLSAVALLCLAGRADAQKLGPVDWILLVDTSQSMRGVGGTKNIFDDVKGSLDSFVSEANDADTVAIHTFDRDVRLHSAMPVNAGSREDLHDIVRGLKAEGNRTHLGAAIAAGLGRAELLRKRNEPNRSRAVVLFTDGKEDVRGIANPTPIAANIARAGDAYIFLVSMGEHEPQLDRFEKATPQARVLKAPTREAIRQIASQIRAVLPPEPPPVPLQVTISPSTIAVGDVTSGELSTAREVVLTSNRPTRVSLTLAGAGGIAMAPQPEIAVAPEVPAKVALQLEVAEDAPAGPRRLTLSATAAEPAAVTVTVVRPSPLVRALKVVVALAVILLLGFIVVQQQRRKNRLEGELEILRPQASPDTAFVGLPKLQVTEVVLSSILPLDALAGSDARLFVRRKGNRKKVWISAQAGSMRVNDVETPMSELYDADTIEIGNAKLRFNRVGDERPLDEYTNQEGSL